MDMERGLGCMAFLLGVFLLCLAIWGSVNSSLEWQAYAADHHCVAVGRVEPETVVSSNGGIGITQPKTIYRCDGGEIQVR